MSSLIAMHPGHQTAPRPYCPPSLTDSQALSCRNEIFRVLRDGGNTLFRSPLSAREIAAIFDVSERTVQVGVASARAIRRAVSELAADES
jgi:hypothetical protein